MSLMMNGVARQNVIVFLNLVLYYELKRVYFVD